MDVMAAKAALRSKMRQMRRALTAYEINIASAMVADRVLATDSFINAGLLLAYVPAKNELDVMPIVKKAVKMGKKVAFPLCVENGGLRLLVPRDERAFIIGSYGIPEPDPALSHEVYADELDLIIVPGIAFTRKRERLGQGGGYYDRLLAKSRAYTLGVGYDFQLVDELPTQEHDHALDCVALPSELIVSPS